MTCMAMCQLQIMQEATHLTHDPDVLAVQFILYPSSFMHCGD